MKTKFRDWQNKKKSSIITIQTSSFCSCISIFSFNKCLLLSHELKIYNKYLIIDLFLKILTLSTDSKLLNVYFLKTIFIVGSIEVANLCKLIQTWKLFMGNFLVFAI